MSKQTAAGTEMATAIPVKNDTVTAMVQSLERIAANPDVNPDNLQKFLDMQVQILDREARQAFAASMAACQSEMPAIARKAVNQQTASTYAKHEAICVGIKPVYTRHGFSLTFHEGKAERDNEIRIICDVTHQLGYSEQHYIDLPLDMTGIKGTVNKTPVHAKGSTISYGRRYLTLMIFDLATYDDNDADFKPVQELISTEQVMNLEALITEIGANKASFLKVCKVDALENLPADKYDAALKRLEERRKAQ